MQSVERKQLKGKENFHANHLQGVCWVSGIGDRDTLPCPRGAYSPLQETDIKQLRVQ